MAGKQTYYSLQAGFCKLINECLFLRNLQLLELWYKLVGQCFSYATTKKIGEFKRVKEGYPPGKVICSTVPKYVTIPICLEFIK